jgi:hypothetical protein
MKGFDEPVRLYGVRARADQVAGEHEASPTTV